MKAVVGVFKSRSDAERGAAELVPLDDPAALALIPGHLPLGHF
jgi:hypothetical protein